MSRISIIGRGVPGAHIRAFESHVDPEASYQAWVDFVVTHVQKSFGDSKAYVLWRWLNRDYGWWFWLWNHEELEQTEKFYRSKTWSPNGGKTWGWKPRAPEPSLDAQKARELLRDGLRRGGVYEAGDITTVNMGVQVHAPKLIARYQDPDGLFDNGPDKNRRLEREADKILSEILRSRRRFDG